MIKFSILGLCLLFSGCIGYQYVSSPHYVPVNLEKGTVTANVWLTHYQLGYTVSNNFSVFTTGYYRQNDGFLISGLGKENSGAFYTTDKHNNYELGVTYYKKLGNHFSYEIVSGIGKGVINYIGNQDALNYYEFSLHAKKLELFIQPDFTYRLNRYFDVTVFSRLNQNRYYDLEKRLKLGGETEILKHDQYFYEHKIGSLLFLEPGIQFRAGMKNIKFQCIYSRAVNLNNADAEIRYRQDNLYLGVTFQFNLEKMIDFYKS